MVQKHVEDNGKNGRFVLYENGVLAGEMTFKWEGSSQMTIDHTNVGSQFGGNGYGRQLVMEAVAFARARNVKIIAECPFVKAVFDKDNSLQDVKA